MLRHGSFGTARWASACGLLLATALGCGSEVKAPNPTKPLDERRALEIIQRAVRAEGGTPAPGRDEKLPSSGKTLHIDVGVQGKRYGIAYVTTDEAEALAGSIPTPNKKDEKLKLVPGGDDGKTHILLLFQQNYLYDDLAGEVHEQTMITTENAVARDVRDFMTYARSKAFE
jgi:hypothetical protein